MTNRNLSFLAHDSIYEERAICYRQSVCPSVTRVYHTKTVEVTIMKFSHKTHKNNRRDINGTVQVKLLSVPSKLCKTVGIS